MTETIELRPSAPRTLARVNWVVERLGVSRQRVYELTRAGVLPHVRLGRSVRYDPEAVERWIEQGGTAASA